MKAIKYVVMGVLMLGMSTSVMAQEAELNAAIQAIKSNAANKADLVKTAQKKNKKDPQALVALGRALYEAKDTAQARVCANMANEAVKPKFSYAPAYLLLGDIESLGEDGGRAAGFYNQAIHFNPKDPQGYKKWAMVYRKISPSQAEQKLKEMEQNCPGEDANAMIGHIYMLSYNSSKSSKDEKAAYDAFKKADIRKFDKTYLNEFARASYFTNHYDDALAACEAGLKLEPRNPTFVRLSMFANYEKGDFEKARPFIHRYFHETDSAKISEYDHYYTALIYKAIKDKEKAYQHYAKALELVNDSSMIKRWDLFKGISDSYMNDSNYVKAIENYRQYLNSKPNVAASDYAGLASLYRKQATAIDEKFNNEEAKAAMLNADKSYEELGQKFKEQLDFAYYMRANVNSSLDPTQKMGLAKPFYEKVVELLEPKSDKDETELSRLKTSYHYLMSYYFIQKNDKATAKELADKILAIDPNYAPAQQIRDLK